MIGTDTATVGNGPRGPNIEATDCEGEVAIENENAAGDTAAVPVPEGEEAKKEKLVLIGEAFADVADVPLAVVGTIILVKIGKNENDDPVTSGGDATSSTEMGEAPGMSGAKVQGVTGDEGNDVATGLETELEGGI